MKRGRHLAYRPVSRRWVLPLALALSLVMGSVAWADNVQNNVTVGGNDTFTAGGSTVVSYRIVANNGDGQTGCNASDGSPAVVTINAPAGVAVSPNPLSFSACSTSLPTTFSSSVAGNYSITVSVSDPGAGTYNTTPATFTLRVLAPTDATPPVITSNVTGTLGHNGWYVSDVTVSWNVSDAESAVSSSSGCGPTTISTDTAGQTLTCSATSAGGTSSQSVTIKRDATAPTISGSRSPDANSYGWNNGDVTVSFNCADNLSGVASCSPDQTLSGEGAGQSATGAAVDNAGNWASHTVSGINIDKTAPSVMASASPDPNGNGWNNSNVTVSFSGSDALSGIASCDSSVILSSEGAGQSASGSCTDKAGNSASATASGIDIDKTAPSVSVTGVSNGATYILGSVPASGCNTSDSLSGVQTAASLSVSGGPVGSFTATCSGAEDKAGNPGSASVAYNVIYDFSGFFRPVDMPGGGPNYVVNRVKAGSAIPVKFSLNGDQGMGVFAPGFPKSQPTSLSANVVMDSIEETVTAGSSSLSYDPVADQYVYVWKTDKAWANTSRTLTVKLIDGTTVVAYFNFTK